PQMMGGSPYGVMPASYQDPMDTSAYYNGPMMGPDMGTAMAMDGGMGMSGPPCMSCGGQGCRRCGMLGGIGNRHRGDCYNDGLLARLLGWLVPYSEGGCCAQRYFDVHVEALQLRREEVSRFVPFTAQGLANPPNIVLSTNDLDFDDEIALRFTGALQIGPGTTFELGYLGLAEYQASAQVTDPNGFLFSVISDFGTNPFNGFDDTDRSLLQSLDYSSEFDSVEMNVRHRWVGPNCRVQGSWLMGVRYFWFRENLLYSTRGDDDNLPPIDRFADFTVGTQNSLTGFQLGGDVWSCIVPGLSVGAEMKAGIYGNYVKQNTTITANSIPNAVQETVQSGDAALIAEAGLMGIYRVSYSWTFRFGYQFLYVDGVALAPENFNTTPPAEFFPIPPDPLLNPELIRTPTLNHNGNVFYHGATAGFEYMW
ncbi:MAG: BBP7 family outer membrane beta-barrel protein, partial [Planctomycetales bacterium]|nr:BBP7 family outer membrane beta-barrel protein [Planctomycetales bacterium]